MPIAFAVSLLLLSGLFVAKRRGLALEERERAYLAYRDDREDLEEWITTMSLPEEIAASLGDLVDFAIDTDSRVVYDPDRDLYVVVHEETHYGYRPPNEGPFINALESDEPSTEILEQSDDARDTGAERSNGSPEDSEEIS